MAQLGASRTNPAAADASAPDPSAPGAAPSAPGSPPSAPGGDARPLRGVARALFVLLRILPKNAMSRAVGWFASRALPGPLQRLEIRLFARFAGVDLDEARDDVADFATLQQFFTRALLPGVGADPGCHRVVAADES